MRWLARASREDVDQTSLVANLHRLAGAKVLDLATPLIRAGWVVERSVDAVQLAASAPSGPAETPWLPLVAARP